MKLGALVGMRDDPEAFGKHLKKLEDAGVDYLWAGEAYTADAVSTMGFIAAVTSRAQIGSAILPLYTRTPSLLAMTAVGLDSLSGGRFILGIGASGPQVVEGFHGVPYDAPLARTAESSRSAVRSGGGTASITRAPSTRSRWPRVRAPALASR